MLSQDYLIEILDYMTEISQDNNLDIIDFCIVVGNYENPKAIIVIDDGYNKYGEPEYSYIEYPIYHKDDTAVSFLFLMNTYPNLIDDYGIRFIYNSNELLYSYDNFKSNPIQKQIDAHLLDIAENSI